METPATSAEASSAQGSTEGDAVNIAKIQELLKAKDDTQRFVGLALLKSVLDNSEHLRHDEKIIVSLWASISPKFLDRLLRTGSDSSNQNAREMLDLVVSVLHTFAVLLPLEARNQAKFVDRIPGLVDAVLQSTGETTNLLLQLLHTAVSSEEGARVFVKVDDVSPLTEIAPSHAIALDILRYAWLNSMTAISDTPTLKQRIRGTIQSLVSSFTGTDAVTLLEFLGAFLRQADPAILPSDPKWLKVVVGYIQKLVTSRPTPEARSSYTNAAASLLQAYTLSTPQLLFTDEKKDDKPFAYLFLNLLLIDIRSSSPVLLEQLNTPAYPKTSLRLTSAFDIICAFIGYLVRSLEDESSESLVMDPNSLLKLRKGISETMSVTTEYLRDRWDASVAGAMGLHPDSRVGKAETSMGSRHTLAWDSMKDKTEDDPLILAAVRALALWLREDENDLLRKESTGLMDMFMDLYKSSASGALDFRSPVLVALEAVITIEQGRELLLSNGGWEILTKDLIAIPQRGSVTPEEEASRGLEVVRVLLYLTEQDSSSTAEDWMNLITAVAAWDVPTSEQHPTVAEFYVAVLTLCCSLLANAGGGMRRRYVHSIGAIHGIARQLSQTLRGDARNIESMREVLDTLAGLEQSL